MILVGSTVSELEVGGDTPQQWEELVAADDAGDLERVSALEVQIWIDGPYRGPDQVEEGVRDLVRETNLIALKNEASELGDERLPKTPAVNRLGEIQVPTLVIVGDQDRPEIIEAADFLERSIPHARNVVIPKTAHLSSMEKPEEFNRIVLEFLEGLRL